MRRYVGALLAVFGLGCSSEPPTPSIVSLSRIASQVLQDLGASEHLIAVDAGSRRVVGLEKLPIVDLSGAVELAPDLVVVPALAEDDRLLAARLRAGGSDVVEFAPHDFEEAYRLCRELGLRVGRADAAHAYVRAHGRELAEMSSAATGFHRPRVAAVIGLAPLVVAGGHSFATDLIEIAGAESVTHGTDERRVEMTRAELLATAPDLVWVIRREPLSETERRAARRLVGDGRPVAFMVFDPELFWLHHAVETARELQALVKPLVRGPI